jgi:ribosome biogenesis protein BRX1
MAAVYKTVSKKKARQIAEDQDEVDIEMEDLLAGADDTSDSDEDEDEHIADAAKKQLAAGFMPKSRVLMLTSRGVTYRYAQDLLATSNLTVSDTDE